MVKAALKMYLVNLIDGGFNCMYCLLTKSEWSQLGDDGTCDNSVFEPFFEEKTSESKRVFFTVTDVFKYMKKHEMELADDCSICQW